MSISITIGPEKVVQAGARWRVVGGSEERGGWLGSGEEATALAPRHYWIEFEPVPGWREPQKLKVRNVDGFNNVKTAAYKPLSYYKLGDIPSQTAWHDQSLEFMLAIDEARMTDVRCQPRPLSEPSLDKETGIFRYRPNAEDKFPFLVTLSCSQGEKTQTFEITPMPVLPPEVDVFRDNWTPAKAAPSTPQVASAALVPTEAVLPQGQEPPAPVPISFSGEEPIGSWAFLEIQTTPQPTAIRAMALGLRRDETEEPTSDIVEYDDEPVIDIEENEEEELFNHLQGKTKNIRIIGENLIFTKDREEFSWLYDMIHDNADIKRLDIFAETVTICNPLHLPQTTISIYARELRFEDGGNSPSYISTTPVDYPTSPAQAKRIPAKDPSGNVKKDARERDIYEDPAANGSPGENGGSITLHIESFRECGRAPEKDIKRFILRGGRGQVPGKGLHGVDGSRLANTSSFRYAKLESRSEKIVYGKYSSIEHFVVPIEMKKEHFANKEQKEWPTDGGNATPPGIPGPGGTGGTLTATLNLVSQADVAGGDPADADKTVYRGGAAGEPRSSVMVECSDIHYFFSNISGSQWTSLDHPGWTHEESFEGKRMFIRKTEPGSDAVQQTVGECGKNGEVICRGHPLSWLHPLLLKEIVKRAKDSYLAGEYETAQNKLIEYAELLDIYQSLEAWNDLDDAGQQELYSIRSEIAVLIARLNSRLDYFGNPAGWVPMLSFEVNQTIFDNEIDRAFEILYLTYWLRKKARGIQKTDQALRKMETKLEEEIEYLQREYTKVSEAFPDLEREAGEISNKINELQQELKKLEYELQQKAEEQINLKTMFKVLGTLISVVPVGQPATGAVGGLVNLAADFDPDDPWKSITGGANVFKTYADASFTRINSDIDNELNQIKIKTLENSNTKLEALKSAKQLQKYTNTLSKGTEGVAKILAERQVPQSEVDALLQKLKAESPEFKQLSEEISAQLELNREFSQEIADALQRLADIPNMITSNLLAIDSLHSALGKGKSVLHDGRLTQHLDAMERRAWERLLKYHYYLAKSYEYRLLRPYPWTLNLDKVFEKMLNLAELNMEGDKPYELDKEKFDSLKGVYEDALATIAYEIVQGYEENRDMGELHAETSFNLTPNEISKLNAGKSVSLNLVDRELIRLSEENVRIYDLVINEAGSEKGFAVSVENPGVRRQVDVDIHFEHSGISQLRSMGRSLAFRHPARSTNPIDWTLRINAIDKSWQSIKPSAASDSLLRSLLKNSTADTIMLYSQPAAWADLKVFMEVFPPSVTAVIDKLRLKVLYDFTPRGPGINVLHIKTEVETASATRPASFKPYFLLDRKDRNERQDGRGAFYRTYMSGTMVQLEAQDHYGQWKFNRWVDQTGKKVGMDPCLEVRVSTDQVIKAVYKLAG